VRILLVYPKFPRDTFWSFDRALRFSGRRSTMPPLGLLTVAAFVDAGEHELALVDENVAQLTDAELEWADIVLSSSMIAQRAALAELADRCRAHSTPLVVGGPLISGCWQQLRAGGFEADAWFVGEAEHVFPELLDDLARGRLRRLYAHVTDDDSAQALRASFGDDVLIHVGERPSLQDAPVPRFDLLDLGKYHSMPLQASRGCPIGCEFCDIWKQYGRKSRSAPARQLLDQLDVLFTLGWRGRVFIVDDNFIGNVAAARELLDELHAWQRKERRLFLPEVMRKTLAPKRLRRLERRFRRSRTVQFPFAFSTEADVRLGSTAPKLTAIRERMVAVGFNSVFLGIETPDPAALREAKKRVNLGHDAPTADSLLSCVRTIRAAGMNVLAGFIVGFDHDPQQVDRVLVDFIQRSAIPVAMVGLLGVIPGTDLERRLTREGRALQRLSGHQTHEFRLDFTPVGRTERQVLEQYAFVLEHVFGRGLRAYFERCRQVLRELPRPPRTGDRVGLRELRALAHSLVALRPRRQYWRFLAWTLARRPRFLGLAIVLSMQGEHLHRLTERKLAAYRAAQTADSPVVRVGTGSPEHAGAA